VLGDDPAPTTFLPRLGVSRVALESGDYLAEAAYVDAPDAYLILVRLTRRA
jgi:hypothetical protein